MFTIKALYEYTYDDDGIMLSNTYAIFTVTDAHGTNFTSVDNAFSCG